VKQDDSGNKENDKFEYITKKETESREMNRYSRDEVMRILQRLKMSDL